MSHRFGGSDRRGFADEYDYRDRRWFGGRDRFDDRMERFGGSGKGRDRQGEKVRKRGKRGGQDKRDKRRSSTGDRRPNSRDRKPNAGDRNQGVKRKSENDSGPDSKKLKPGNNWHGADRHALMHARPMESKPENFEDEWVFVVRPLGRRRTVVAANNITQSYNNVYDPDMKFETCLPSGNITKDAMFKQQDLTILDTVYSPEKKKFYVIDMVHWRHYPYYETEAEFRFFCLEDKWLQLERPGESWTLNDYPLHLLHKYPCTSENIEEALKDFNEKVDDILFIKKDSLYLPSETSDCLKLRLDKLQEILGIAVPDGVEFATSSRKVKDEKVKDEKVKDEKVKDEKKKEDKVVKDEKMASEEKSEGNQIKEDESKTSPDSDQAADHEDDMDDGEEQEHEDKEEENQDDENSVENQDDENSIENQDDENSMDQTEETGD